MYLPPAFDETRSEEVHRLVDAHPLGTLVTSGPAGLDANHLPFEWDRGAGPHGVLRAHVARANPLLQAGLDGGQVLVIFHGPQAYVTPQWLPSKQVTHAQVPTWNYQVVHVHGTFRVRDDERHVHGVVARLTSVHERRTVPDAPWKMGDLDAEARQSMLARIVGIDVEVQRIVAKSKLGQNESPEDRAGMVAGLREHGDHPSADAALRAEGLGR